MNKYWKFLPVIICMCLFCFFGCGDIYANMSITTNIEGNYLQIVLDNDDLSSYSKEVEVTLKGYDDGMNTNVDIQYSLSNVVSATVLSVNNGVSKIKITAIGDAKSLATANKTVVTFVSKENNKIKSSPITVEIVYPVKDIASTDTHPSVKIGSNIVLNNESLIQFSPASTTQRSIKYEFVDEHSGLELVTNDNGQTVVKALATAREGVYKIRATSTSIQDSMTSEQQLALTCTKYLMVYKNISSDSISLMKIVGDTSSSMDASKITMATASNEISSLCFNVALKNDDTSLSNYKVTAKVDNATICSIVEEGPTDSTYYHLRAFGEGNANLTISVTMCYTERHEIDGVMVSDVDIEFITFTRIIPIQVIQIAYSVQLKTKAMAEYSDQPLNINVVGKSATNKGTEFSVNIQPDLAVNKDFMIDLVEVNGNKSSTINSYDLNTYKSQIYISFYYAGKLYSYNLATDTKYTNGLTDKLKELTSSSWFVNNTTLYVYVDDACSITNNFKLQVSSKSSEAGIPEATNTVTCNIKSGVTAISDIGIGSKIFAENNFQIENDSAVTYPMVINFKTLMGNNVGTHNFTIYYCDNYEIGRENVFTTSSQYIDITQTATFNRFIITTKKIGQTKLKICVDETEDGISILYDASILSKITNFDFVDNTDSQSETRIGKIAKSILKNETDDRGYSEIWVTKNSQIPLTIRTNPVDAFSTITITKYESSNPSKVIINDSKLIAIGETTIPITITATFNYWNGDGVEWTESTDTRTFKINVFIPIKNFTWSNGMTNTDVYIYDKKSLYYNNQNSASVNLTAHVGYDGTEYPTYRNVLWGGNKYPITDNSFTIDYITYTIDGNAIKKDGDEVAVYNDGYEFTLNGIDYIINGSASDRYVGLKNIYYDDTHLDITSSNNVSFNVCANLANNEDSATSTITMSVSEPGRTYYITCTVHIIKPTLVADINVNKTELYLETSGDKKNADLSVSYSPNNAYDNNFVTYFIQCDVAGIPSLNAGKPQLHTGNIATCSYDSITNQYKITAQNGGYALLRFIPRDRLISDEADKWESVTVYKDVFVYVGDGTEDYKYKIFNDVDFSKIMGNSQYIIMNSISLTTSVVSEFIGTLTAVDGVVITTSCPLFTNLNGANISNFTINMNLNNITCSSDTYFGAIARQTDNTIISNVNVTIKSINETISVSNCSLYFGGIVGKTTNSNIDSCNVAINSLRLATSNMTALYVGGVVGYINNDSGTKFINSSDNNSSVVCNIEIETTGTLTYSCIGGVAGNNTGTINNVRLEGGIIANGIDHVGGVVGNNSGNINNCETDIKIYGNDYVGGIAGTNSGTITNCVVQCYDSSTLNAEDIYAIRGNSYVGGLIGSSTGGNITYSYIMSWVNATSRSMTTVTSTPLGRVANVYYGDIIGVTCVGGLIGSCSDTTIESCFNRARINATNSNTSSIGGLIGTMSRGTINYSFANNKILVVNDATNVGEIIGVVENGVTLNQVYARVVINKVNTTLIQDAYGSGTPTTQTAVYYYDSSSISDLTRFHNNTNEDDSSNGDIPISLSGNGFAIGEKIGDNYIGSVFWANYSETIGINDDALVLVNSAKNGILYKQGINDISITSIKNGNKETGSVLAPYFKYANGLVVNLTGIYKNGHMELPLSGEDSPISISVSPAGLDSSDWKLYVLSSNTDIMTIKRENSSLNGSYMVFTGKPGVVTLTLQSMTDLTVKESLEINVIVGFTGFNFESDTYNIKVNNAKNLAPQVSKILGYYDNIGIKYSLISGNTTNISFAGDYIWVTGNIVEIPLYGVQHILNGLSKSDNTITAVPYIVLTFNNIEYKLYLDSTTTIYTGCSKELTIKVVDGLSSVTLDMAKADIYSKDCFTLDIECISDVDVDLYISNIDSFIDRESSSDDKNNITGNIDTLGKIDLTDNQASLTITKDTKKIDVNITKSHTDGSKIYIYTLYFEMKEDSGVLKDNTASNRYLSDDILLQFNFKVKDNCGNEISKDFELTIKPTPISQINATFYQNGISGMATDVPNQNISPGKAGVFVLDISNYYASFDYLKMSSSIASGDKISFSQLVYDGVQYVDIENFSAYTDREGNLLAQPVTQQNDSTDTYTGRLYIKTLISSDIPKDTKFVVTITPYLKGNANTNAQIQIELTACFVPYITIDFDSANKYDGKIIVAKGTTLGFTLSGRVINTTIKLDSTYYGDGISKCEFDTKTIHSYENTGGAECDVSVLGGFYVGIGATPDDGKFTISVTLESNIDGVHSETLYVTYTIYVVDFMVKKYFIINDSGGETSSLTLSPTTWTKLRLGWELVDQTNKYGVADFDDKLTDIKNSANTLLASINAFGVGTEDGNSIWQLYKDGAYGSLGKNTSVKYFAIESKQIGDTAWWCWQLKGASIVDGLQMQGVPILSYIYDSESGYQLSIGETGLINATPVPVQFTIDVAPGDDDDSPCVIGSQAQLAGMEVGISYILDKDIELIDWEPLQLESVTKTDNAGKTRNVITTLDGNSHKITIKSFKIPSNNSSVNVGIFDTINSYMIVKNLIVDMSNIAFVDISNHTNVNFGIIAGKNEGIIYNCDIIVSSNDAWIDSYKNANSGATASTNLAKLPQFGQQVFESWSTITGIGLTNGSATLMVITSDKVQNTSVTTYIGGMVGYNTGSISNSRVGLIGNIGYGDKSKEQITSDTGLNIIASGNVGGLAGYNNGVISASYFKNGCVVNAQGAGATGTKTAGLVAEQGIKGRINTSYVESAKNDGEIISYTSDSIISYGTIAGLVHTNAGSVENCYSNISLQTSDGAGGFVYYNSGTIKTCYSLSKVEEYNRVYGYFTGLDGSLEIKNEGTIQDCYYVEQDDVVYNDLEPATKLTLENIQDKSCKYFMGFVLNDQMWKIPTEDITYYLPTLVEADNIAKSYRSLNDSGSKATYVYQGNNPGTKENPFIITGFYSLIGINDFDSRLTTEVSNKFYRIVGDVDFENNSPATTTKTFKSCNIQGNGMNLTRINVDNKSAPTSDNSLGLFAVLDKSTVVNLNILLENGINAGQYYKVGGLAGGITGNSSKISNINIMGTENSEEAKVQGLHLVGGLAGYVGSEVDIQGINCSVSVYATYQSTGQIKYYTSDNIDSVSYVSYAGGIIGLACNNTESTTTFKYLNVSGAVDILAEISGGLVGGLMGCQVTNSNFQVDEASMPTIRASVFAGGLVGESHQANSKIIDSYISIGETAQNARDLTMTSVSNGDDYVGYAGLFQHDEQTLAIGGIVGLNIGATIENCYSRVAVLSTNAVVAGGVIGLATTINNVSWLENITQKINSRYNTSLLYSVGSGFSELQCSLNNKNGKYEVSEFSNISETIDISATIDDCYTTSPVYASETVGGLVGLVADSFVDIGSSHVIALNNYPTNVIYSATNNTHTYNIGNVTRKGSLIGYLNFNYTHLDYISPFIHYSSSGSCYIVKGDDQVYSTTWTDIVQDMIEYNYSSAVHPTCFKLCDDTSKIVKFIPSSDDNINTAFKAWADSDDTSWIVDVTRLKNVFPVLGIGIKSTNIEIKDATDLLSNMQHSSDVSTYEITENITIQDNDWYNAVGESGTLGDTANPVCGTWVGNNHTITLTLTQSSNISNFKSLCNVINNMNLSDITFKFDFKTDTYSSSDIADFGLLAQTIKNSRFNNVTINFKLNDNQDEKITINSNTNNFGILCGQATNTTFNNITITGTMITYTDNSNSANILNIGSVFGKANSTVVMNGELDINNTINVTTYRGVNVGMIGGNADCCNIELTNTSSIQGAITTTTYNTANIGGLFGEISGNGNSKVYNSNNNVTIAVTRNGNNTNVGGIVGKGTKVSISDCDNQGCIQFNDNNSSSGMITIGGIAGYIDNAGCLYGSYISGNEINRVCNKSNINATINTANGVNATCNIGGIIGYAKYTLSNTNNSSAISGNAFNNMISQGKITITSYDTLNAGGLIGKTALYDASTFRQTNLSNIKIANSVTLCDIEAILNNDDKDSCIGGLVGENQIMLEDCLSNGYIKIQKGGAYVDFEKIFVGGMFGKSNITSTNLMTFTPICLWSANQISLQHIDAIVGYKEVNTYIGASYYVPSMTGILDYNGNINDLTLDDLIGWKNISGLSSWTKTAQSDENYILPYPTSLSGILDTDDTKMKLTKVTLSSVSSTMIEGASLYIGSESASLSNIELINIRRLVGYSNATITLNTNATITLNICSCELSENDIAIFKSIGAGIVVSDICVNFGNITYSDSNDTNININVATFVANNNGSLYNCSVGTIPQVNGSIDFKTYSNNLTGSNGKYSNNVSRYTSSNYATIVYNSNVSSNLSALCGNNAGSIVGCYTYVDFVIMSNSDSKIGAIVANDINGYISDCYNVGKITYVSSDTATAVGGLVGNADGTYIKACISNTNIYLTQNTSASNIGLAIGNASNITQYGVVVNADISINSLSNSIYDKALPTYGGLTAITNTDNNTFYNSANDVIQYFGMNKIWIQDYTRNYGLPYLKNSSISLISTGNGYSSDPFQIIDSVQLKRACTYSGNYILTKDLMFVGNENAISSDWQLCGSLGGNGHSIFVEKYNRFSSASEVGLFYSISRGVTVQNLCVVAKGETIDNSVDMFGGLACICYGATNISNVAIDCVDSMSFVNTTGTGFFGGLFAESYCNNITNCWCDIDISISNGNVGGFIGKQKSNLTIATSFVSSTMKQNDQSGSNVYAFIADASDKTITIRHCYYREIGTITFDPNNIDNIGYIVNNGNYGDNSVYRYTKQTGTYWEKPKSYECSAIDGWDTGSGSNDNTRILNITPACKNFN